MRMDFSISDFHFNPVSAFKYTIVILFTLASPIFNRLWKSSLPVLTSSSATLKALLIILFAKLSEKFRNEFFHKIIDDGEESKHCFLNILLKFWPPREHFKKNSWSYYFPTESDAFFPKSILFSDQSHYRFLQKQ